MEYDFSDLRAEIAKIDAAFIRAGTDVGSNIFVSMFSSILSHRIAVTLKPFLDEVTPNTPPDLLQEMDFLYEKMIAFKPLASLGHFVKGQFHFAREQFDKAVDCFTAAYNIERDPTRATWPHLQAIESNARTIIFLGHSLYHSGQVEEGKRFVNAGQKMMEKFKKSPDTPEPS